MAEITNGLNQVDALALLIVRATDISKMTPSQVNDLYQRVRYEIIVDNRFKTNSGWFRERGMTE